MYCRDVGHGRVDERKRKGKEEKGREKEIEKETLDAKNPQYLLFRSCELRTPGDIYCQQVHVLEAKKVGCSDRAGDLFEGFLAVGMQLGRCAIFCMCVPL